MLNHVVILGILLEMHQNAKETEPTGNNEVILKVKGCIFNLSKPFKAKDLPSDDNI